jgi:hypothetical protein
MKTSLVYSYMYLEPNTQRKQGAHFGSKVRAFENLFVISTDSHLNFWETTNVLSCTCCVSHSISVQNDAKSRRNKTRVPDTLIRTSWWIQLQAFFSVQVALYYSRYKRKKDFKEFNVRFCAMIIYTLYEEIAAPSCTIPRLRLIDRSWGLMISKMHQSSTVHGAGHLMSPPERRTDPFWRVGCQGISITFDGLERVTWWLFLEVTTRAKRRRTPRPPPWPHRMSVHQYLTTA